MSGVMRFNIIPAGQPNPSPSGLYVRHEDYDQLHAANQRLENDYKESVADGMEAARQIHRLESEVKRSREALDCIREQDYDAPHDATDTSISMHKGLCIARMKRIAEKALSTTANGEQLASASEGE